MKIICQFSIALLVTQASIGHARDPDEAIRYFDIHYYRYEEPSVMSVKAILPAISIGLRNDAAIRDPQRTGDLSWTVEGALGYTEYRGTGTHKHNFYKLLGEMYTPVYKNIYLGLGYRVLFDDFGPGQTSSGERTYDRLSQYFYMPVGTTIYANDGSRAKLQFNYLIGGAQTSYLTQVPGYLNDPKNTQETGYGLDLAYTPRSSNWEAYLRYWNIKQSDFISCRTTSGTSLCYEPDNNTFEIGVRYAF